METLDNLVFVDGLATIKNGKKTIAKIYDRKVFYEKNNINSKFSEKYPYSIEIKGVGSRECENLEECKFYIKKYTDVFEDGGLVPTPTLDKLIGGRADGKAIWDIAIKHNVSSDYAMEQLDKGLTEEKEHTQDFKTRYEIALDHLYDDIEYYNKLEKMAAGGTISKAQEKRTQARFKHWEGMPISGVESYAQYLGNKKLSYNKMEYGLTKDEVQEIIDYQIFINKNYPQFNYYLSTQHKKMETGGTIKHPKHICEGIIITDVHTNEKFEIKSLQPVGLTLEKVTSIGSPFTKEISYEEFVSKWKSGGISISNYDCANADDVFILELCFDNICKSHKIKDYETEKEERINKEKIRKRVAEAVKLDIDNVEENVNVEPFITHASFGNVKLHSVGNRHYLEIGSGDNYNAYSLTDSELENVTKEMNKKDMNPMVAVNYLKEMVKDGAFKKITKEKMAKGGTIPQKEKVAKVMEEYKEGELTSHGKTVTDPKQAVAISLNEAGLSKKGRGRPKKQR